MITANNAAHRDSRDPSCPAGLLCHRLPGCTDLHCPGRPASVTRVKASHAPAEPKADASADSSSPDVDGLEIDLPFWPVAAVAIFLVLFAIGASALIAGAVTAF